MTTPSATAASPAIAPRYLTRFRCTAGDCEDTCCAGWAVVLDEPHFVALSQVMSRTAEERAEFAAAHHLLEAPDACAARWAVLARRPDGLCAMLTGDRMCGIQNRYGEGLLPSVCASYPRGLASINGRREVTATLSCPEAARLCLFGEEAMALDEVGPDALRLLQPKHHIGSRPDDPWIHYFDDVRGAVLGVLGRLDDPLTTRLMVIAWFSERLGPLLRRGVAALDERALCDLIGALQRSDVLDQWRQHMRDPDEANPQVTDLLLEGLAMHGATPLPSFSRVVGRAMEAFGGRPEGEAGRFVVIPDAAHAAYAARRGRIDEGLAARLDAAMTNYAYNFWLREPYAASPDLLAHTLKLLFRMALVRFLLAGQPLLATDEPVDEAEFDRALVEVVYATSRAIDHDAGFVAAVDRRLGGEGERTLSRAAAMIQF